MPPEIVKIVITAMICGSIIFLSLVSVWARVKFPGLSRRNARPLPDTSADVEDRLRRIEVTLDAMAIETERNGEAQRFLVKLMSERGISTPVPAPRPLGSITPH